MATMAAESRRRRRQFTDEFRAQAVRLVLDEGRSVGAVARELDLTESALRLWVQRTHANRTKGKTGLTTAEREELTRLRRENRILQEEREILRSGGLLRQAPAVRFAFIAVEKAHHQVTRLCRCLRVTRSGFYAWVRRGLSARTQRDLVLRTKLRALHTASGHRYGRPRLWKDLGEDGEPIAGAPIRRRTTNADLRRSASCAA